MSNMHYCYKCGKALPEGSVFCPYCGERIPDGVYFSDDSSGDFSNSSSITDAEIENSARFEQISEIDDCEIEAKASWGHNNLPDQEGGISTNGKDITVPQYPLDTRKNIEFIIPSTQGGGNYQCVLVSHQSSSDSPRYIWFEDFNGIQLFDKLVSLK